MSTAGYKRRQADDDEEEEEPWVPGQKRKAALKSRSKYRDESGDTIRHPSRNAGPESCDVQEEAT